MEKFFFANWKENHDYPQAVKALEDLVGFFQGADLSGKVVVILPPVVYLVDFYNRLKSQDHLWLGVQDVSRFVEGPYTGEVSGKMVSPFAKFCLVGHSERRTHFNEGGQVVNEKIKICRRFGIIPVVCVSSRQQVLEIELPSDLQEGFVAYEPIPFIGGEKTQEVKEILSFSSFVRQNLRRGLKFIYGGSVTAENVKELKNTPGIDGFLVGHVSLDSRKFSQIVLS